MHVLVVDQEEVVVVVLVTMYHEYSHSQVVVLAGDGGVRRWAGEEAYGVYAAKVDEDADQRANTEHVIR
jgi:hypothetical protein